MIPQHNNTNNEASLLALQKAQLNWLEQAKQSQEMVALQKTVEPLTEAIEDLTDVVQEARDSNQLLPVDYTRKELNKNLIAAIDRACGLLDKVKQLKLDFGPLVTELRSQNATLLALAENLSNDKGRYEGLLKETMAMIQRSDAFISGFALIDYSGELKKIRESLENSKPILEWEFIITRSQYGNLIQKVTAIAVIKQ